VNGEAKENTNSIRNYLLTLYSQSKNNSGTRGLDDLGRKTMWTRRSTGN